MCVPLVVSIESALWSARYVWLGDSNARAREGSYSKRKALPCMYPGSLVENTSRKRYKEVKVGPIVKKAIKKSNERCN